MTICAVTRVRFAVIPFSVPTIDTLVPSFRRTSLVIISTRALYLLCTFTFGNHCEEGRLPVFELLILLQDLKYYKIEIL